MVDISSDSFWEVRDPQESKVPQKDPPVSVQNVLINLSIFWLPGRELQAGSEEGR